MLKFVHAESKTIISAAAIVGVLSFASRIVGLVRDRILAGTFGAGDVLDVYYAAFKIPDLLFGLIAVGALSASFIPLFTKYYSSKSNPARAWELMNNVLHLIVITVAAVSLLTALMAPQLMPLIAPGFSAVKQAHVADFLRVMLVSQILLSASLVFGSALQGMKRFFLYALAPIFYNIGIIVGSFVFVPIVGPIGLAFGVVLGALLHVCVQFVGVTAAGYRYRIVAHTSDKDTREILRLMGPRMLGIGISQIQMVILTVLASTLAIGSVTVFQFAYNIQFFAVGIIGVSFAIAAFPVFAQTLESDAVKEFVKSFSATIRHMLFFMIPLMLLFLVLRAQIVRVVVGAGAFDWSATILTADALAFFSLSLVAQCGVFILVRAFFALHDTITPLIAGVVSTVFGIIIAVSLTERFGVSGLAAGFSAASYIQLILLWLPLRQRTKTLDEAEIVQSLFRMTTAGLFAAVVMQSLKPVAVALIPLDTFLGVFSQGLMAGGAGLATYVYVSYVLKSPELAEMVEGLKRKILRKYKPEEALPSETSVAS